eukprot:tig00000863_g4992.t1
MSSGGGQHAASHREDELELSGSLNLSSGQLSSLSLSGNLNSAIGSLPVEDLIHEVDKRAEGSGSVRSLKDVKISKLVEALARTPVQSDYQQEQAGTLQRLGSLTLSVDDWWSQNVHDILGELNPGGATPQGIQQPPAASSSEAGGARSGTTPVTPIAEMTLGQALDRLDSSLLHHDNKRARNLPVEDFCQQLLSLTKQDSSTMLPMPPGDSLDAYQMQAANAAALRGALPDPATFSVLHSSHGAGDLHDSGLLAHAATFPGSVLPIAGYQAPRTLSEKMHVEAAGGGSTVLPGGFLPRLGSTSSTTSASPLTLPLHTLALGPDPPLAAAAAHVSHPASLSSLGTAQSPELPSAGSQPMPSIILTEATVRGRDFREQLRAHLEQMQRDGDGAGDEGPDVEYADDINLDDDDDAPARPSLKAVAAPASAKLGAEGRGARAGAAGPVGGAREMARKRSLSEMSNASSEIDSDLDDGASSTGSRARPKHDPPRATPAAPPSPPPSPPPRTRSCGAQSAELNAEDFADPNSKEAKQALRKLKNRESALRSRLRKEQHVRDLEEQVASLATENEELRRAVERMQLQKRRDDLALRKTVELLARADATIDSFRRAAAAASIGAAESGQHSFVAEASAMLAEVATRPAGSLARPPSYRVSPTASGRAISPGHQGAHSPSHQAALEPPSIKRSSSWNS